ncbi:hypothetical protein IAR55_003794 [Kwoniella newhampshirensis]|uniref:NADP-dependent oxidoreductase domain-containing protein n=1 Tax=Kwoniella newhampshirensis TaxID=1651941 RepID=A0AAW0YXW6_9TREE
MTPQLSMPKIMYGTAWKKERTAELVVQAVKAGFRGIDTACQPKHYREDFVGKAISTLIGQGVVKREELYIQTKFTSIDGQDRSQPLPYDPKAPIPEQVKQSFATSLKNLGVEYIDSVVLHSPLPTRDQTLQAYRTLEDFVSEGKVRKLGVSNCYDPKLLTWKRLGLERVQYMFGERHSVPVILDAVRVGLTDLANKYSLTPEQTVYKLCQLWNITPLCGSKSLAHVNEAIAVEGATGLTEDTPEVKQLWDAMHGV